MHIGWLNTKQLHNSQLLRPSFSIIFFFFFFFFVVDFFRSERYLPAPPPSFLHRHQPDLFPELVVATSGGRVLRVEQVPTNQVAVRRSQVAAVPPHDGQARVEGLHVQSLFYFPAKYIFSLVVSENIIYLTEAVVLSFI